MSDYITSEGRYCRELDIIDPEKTAALTEVRCYGCDHQDVAIDMVLQSDGEYLCPECDYKENLQNRLERTVR